MTYQQSNYTGDAEYSIMAHGDVVTGDDVRFERATFTGSFRNAKFAGFERVSGRIVADSYGADRQQHTFTIEIDGGKKIRIKGRNLYANGVWRKPWSDETARRAAQHEKHARGDTSRAERETRRAEQWS